MLEPKRRGEKKKKRGGKVGGGGGGNAKKCVDNAENALDYAEIFQQLSPNY